MHLTRLLICQVTLAKGNNHASSSSLSYPYPPAKQVRSAPSKPLLRIPSWNHFPLDKSIHEYLSSNEIHTPTYIQYALLASLTRQQNNFHHIISPTGSGKTLAYMLPIADRLKK